MATGVFVEMAEPPPSSVEAPRRRRGEEQAGEGAAGRVGRGKHELGPPRLRSPVQVALPNHAGGKEGGKPDLSRLCSFFFVFPSCFFAVVSPLFPFGSFCFFPFFL